MPLFEVKPFMVIVAKGGVEMERIIFKKQTIAANSKAEVRVQIRKKIKRASSFWLYQEGVAVKAGRIVIF